MYPAECVRRTVLAVIGSLTFLFVVEDQRVYAGFMLSMSIDGTPAAFTVNSGQQSANIPVYLLQTGGESRLNTVGLFAAGATLTFQSGPDQAQYQSGSAQLTSHWDDTIASKIVFDNASSSLRLQGITTSVVNAAAGSDAVQIGTFRVIGGSVGTTTIVTISLPTIPSDPILLNDFTKILPGAANTADRLTFNTGTITSIASVPEPSTWVLLGTATITMLVWRRFSGGLKALHWNPCSTGSA